MTTDEQENLFHTSVKPEDLKEAYKIPALSSNKFIASIGATGVRIAFGEKHEELEQPVYFSAVTLNHIDAISLYKLLEHLLRDFESQAFPKSDEDEDG